MKADIRYEFHHVGIPCDTPRPGERYSAAAGMYTADNPGRFRIQWHRFTADSPLDPRLRTVPHVAFKVDDLAAAIDGETVILGPYMPIDGYRVAVIDDHGVPIELIETELPDDVIWARAARGEGELYRSGD